MHKSRFFKVLLCVGILGVSTSVFAKADASDAKTGLKKEYEEFEETQNEIAVSAALDEKDDDICYIQAAVPNLPSDVKKVTFHLTQREKKKDKGEWYTGKKKGDETWQITLDDKDLSTETAYEVKVYGEKDQKDRIYLGKTAFLINEEENSDSSKQEEEGEIKENLSASSQEILVDDATNNALGYYTIMGNSTVTVEQMIQVYNDQGVSYPGEVLGEGGAPKIEDFCQILYEECAAEGVRAEVAFAQSMLETGWLQFQGDSTAEQYNFAGLGTTGGGVKGIYFPDVRTGLRAQVQHLKAYASSENLNEECVDERFDLVSRESAPYVEWLGIQENPNGGGWAAGANYGDKLLKLIDDLKAVN